jgi:threonine/homoserine/homoserine lactone efflux protein
MLPTSSLLAVFVFSFAIGFGAVISPGPVSTAIVSETPRRGWQVGPLVASGHSLMELLIIVLIALGLGTVLAHPSIQTAIALLGGLLLAWMGAGMLWSVWKGRLRLPSAEATIPHRSHWRLVGLGVLATLSNPFWYAWWVTVAAGYLAQARALGIAAVAAFYLGHVSADYTWDTTLSGIVGSGRRWFSDRLYRALIALSGVFFIYLGWVFLAQGVRLLRGA